MRAPTVLAVLVANLTLLLVLGLCTGPSCGPGEDLGEPLPAQTPCDRQGEQLRDDMTWYRIADDGDVAVYASDDLPELVLSELSSKAMQQGAAQAYCEALTVDGWEGSFRLPTLDDLSLLDERFGISSLPMFRWQHCNEESGFRSSVIWAAERSLEIDALVLLPPLLVLPYPVEAGKALHVYSVDEETDPTVYQGSNRPQLDGMGLTLCVGER